MNRGRLLGGLLLLVAIVAVGCRPADPMPGTWKLYVAGEGKDKPVSGSAEFRSDNTCEMNTSFGKATWRFQGVYAVNGSELRIEGEVTEDIPGGFDKLAQIQIKPEHRTSRLTTTGTIAENWKSFRINGKDFIKE